MGAKDGCARPGYAHQDCGWRRAHRRHCHGRRLPERVCQIRGFCARAVHEGVMKKAALCAEMLLTGPCSFVAIRTHGRTLRAEMQARLHAQGVWLYWAERWQMASRKVRPGVDRRSCTPKVQEFSEGANFWPSENSGISFPRC